MKKMISPLTMLFILAFSTEAFSQARSRPSSGRDSGRTGSSSSTGSSYSSGYSSSGGSSYGGSSRPSSSSGSSSSSGPSSSGSSWSSGSSSGSYTPSRSRTGAPSNRRVTPSLSSRENYEPVRNGSVRNVGRDSSRSPMHRPTTYVRNSPRTGYPNPTMFHHETSRSYVYQTWILEPAPFYYNDGYYFMDNYDWYCYQGYRFRYSDVDPCTYDLLDVRTNTTLQSFENMTCKEAYDKCAEARDVLTKNPDYYDPKDYYVCAERVDEQYKNEEVKSFPTLASKYSPEVMARVSAFVQNRSDSELFKLGQKKGVNGCKIIKAPKNSNRCNYVVSVDGKMYPEPDGSVCSNIRTSDDYGCSTSSQSKNAACLLSLAIMEGQCMNVNGEIE